MVRRYHSDHGSDETRWVIVVLRRLSLCREGYRCVERSRRLSYCCQDVMCCETVIVVVRRLWLEYRCCGETVVVVVRRRGSVIVLTRDETVIVPVVTRRDEYVETVINVIVVFEKLSYVRSLEDGSRKVTFVCLTMVREVKLRSFDEGSNN